MAECKVHWLNRVQKERRKSPRNSRNERRAVPLLASKIGSKFLLLTSLSLVSVYWVYLRKIQGHNGGAQCHEFDIWSLKFRNSTSCPSKSENDNCAPGIVPGGDSLRKTPFLLLVLACCYQLLKSQNCLLAICSQEHDGSFPLFILRSSKPQL